MAMAAVSAGTVLAWTSPVIPQMKAENSSLPITSDEGKNDNLLQIIADWLIPRSTYKLHSEYDNLGGRFYCS